jgi:hypothetical protein
MFLSCSTASVAAQHISLIAISRPSAPVAGIPGDVDRGAAERAVQRRFDRADLGQILVGQDRLVDLEPLVRARIAAEQVGARADHADQAHHQFLADRVDRRVGDLGEVLLEIIVEQSRLVDSTAIGVSVPIEPIGSSPSTAIGSRNGKCLPACSRRPAGDPAAWWSSPAARRQFGLDRSRSLSLYCACFQPLHRARHRRDRP